LREIQEEIRGQYLWIILPFNKYVANPLLLASHHAYHRLYMKALPHFFKELIM
jgi:hypothetical protein